MAGTQSLLRKLARLYGVQTSYVDVSRRRRSASTESLLRVAAALGAPVHRPADVPDAIRLRQRETWGRVCEPVVVAWEGNCPPLELRLPDNQSRQRLRAVLQREEGESQTFTYHLADLPADDGAKVDGTVYVVKRLPTLGTLPLGYHRLRVEGESAASEVLIVSAPQKAFSHEDPKAARSWGVLAPLYALHSGQSLGAGSLRDMAALWQWVASCGGRLIATLPFLSTYLDEPFDCSPYAPVSRLFWNEFYADPTDTAEFARCPAARELFHSAVFQEERTALLQAELVDYRRQMALRRRVLEVLAEDCFEQGGARREALNAFAAGRPEVEDYARFRAAGERLRRPWPEWPEPLRSGRVPSGSYDESAFRYHLYAQWITEQQITELAATLRQEGSALYLDLPLGVHRHSFDTWRHPVSFVFHVSGGAPPDAVFTQGQDWGFAPLHPEHIRSDGYRYVLEGLRSHLRQAGLLRIDHVMGLHRLYWIPEGLPAADGVYVRYPAEELYALLCLESHRSRVSIVGENLGTVPPYINAAMRRHAIRRTYVVQYELNSHAGEFLKVPESHAVAAVNTHDMPPFMAFWQGADLDDLHRLGLFNDREIAVERERRQAIRTELIRFLRAAGHLASDQQTPEGIFAAVLRWLAASPAQHLLINLEDLWFETLSQNTPGTLDQRPNWRRKMRYSLEAIQKDPRFAELLKQVDQLRRAPPGVKPNRVQ